MLDLPGFFVLIVAAAASSWVLYRAVSYHRTRTFLDSLVRTAFLPEKRRATLWILAFEGASVLLTGLVAAALRLGFLTPGPAEAVLVALNIVAIGSVVAMCEIGLSPGTLTEKERQAFRRDAPELLRSLAFMAADPARDEAGALVPPTPGPGRVPPPY